MKTTIRQWILDKSRVYVRHGGKQYRRSQVKLMIKIVEHIAKYKRGGLASPENISRGDIFRYYLRAYKVYARSTVQRKHYYAIRTLWRDFLQRDSDPPKLW